MQVNLKITAKREGVSNKPIFEKSNILGYRQNKPTSFGLSGGGSMVARPMGHFSIYLNAMERRVAGQRGVMETCSKQEEGHEALEPGGRQPIRGVWWPSR